MTVGVGSPDVSRNSRQSEVLTSWFSGRLSTPVESPGPCQESRHLELYWLTDWARRKSRCLSGVLTLTCLRVLLTLREQCFLLMSEVSRSASGSPNVDLNGSIFTWSINTPLFTSNRYGLTHCWPTSRSTAPKQLKLPSPSPLAPIFDSLSFLVKGEWIKWEHHFGKLEHLISSSSRLILRLLLLGLCP